RTNGTHGCTSVQPTSANSPPEPGRTTPPGSIAKEFIRCSCAIRHVRPDVRGPSGRARRSDLQRTADVEHNPIVGSAGARDPGVTYNRHVACDKNRSAGTKIQRPAVNDQVPVDVQRGLTVEYPIPGDRQVITNNKNLFIVVAAHRRTCQFHDSCSPDLLGPRAPIGNTKIQGRVQPVSL